MLLVPAPGEARMTPRRPRSSLAQHGPDSAREAPGWAGVRAPKQQHLSGAAGSVGTADGAGADVLPGWCSGRRAVVSPGPGMWGGWWGWGKGWAGRWLRVCPTPVPLALPACLGAVG